MSSLVVPIALVILIGLFMGQRFGTGAVGWLFAPVIGLWFLTIAVLGVHQSRGAVRRPRALRGRTDPLHVVLGRAAGGCSTTSVRRRSAVAPIHGLQSALPDGTAQPRGAARRARDAGDDHRVAGSDHRVVSVAKQAIQLGLLPRLKVVQTSNIEGQIYVPIINWFLCIGVAALVLVFRSSNRLTDIYGVAVTGTSILNTILFTGLARAMWSISWWRLAPMCTLFLLVEISFFGANLTKVDHGAWLSLAVGVGFASLMLTWRSGRQILTANRVAEEGSLDAFLAELPDQQPSLRRVPGTAIYLAPTTATTPLALRAEVEANHVLHETVTMAPPKRLHGGTDLQSERNRPGGSRVP